MKSVPFITGGLSFLLSACSGGGGSFDVDDVSNPSSSKPRYQDDTSNQRKKSDLQKLSIPSLGGGMKLVAQNLRGNKEPSLLNEDGYMIFSSRSTIKEDVKKVKNNNKNGGGGGTLLAQLRNLMEHHKILIHKNMFILGCIISIVGVIFRKAERKKLMLILAITAMRFIMVIRLQQNCQ